MATNGAIHRKGSAQDEVTEESAQNYLHQIKSSGGMTITPELFEKVIWASFILTALTRIPVSD